MLKDQPKLWWPDRFEKATEVLTFLSHAYTPGAQFGVILAGVAGSRRRRHPLGPRGVERPLANGARCRAFGQKEGVPRRPFFCCSSATGPNKRAVGVREPRAKGTPRHNRTRDQGYVTAGLKGDGSMLHGQGNSAASDPHVIPFAKGSKSSPVDVADQLDKAGQTILQLLHRAAGVAEENSRSALETAQKLSHSCAQPKIGSPSWKHTSPLIRREPTERSNGFIASTLKLKSEFIRNRDDRYGTTRRTQSSANEDVPTKANSECQCEKSSRGHQRSLGSTSERGDCGP